MDADCQTENGHKSEVEQLFAEHFAADILMSLLERDGQTRSEIQHGICGGKSPGKALGFLKDKGLFTVKGMTVNLTPKGREAAEILHRLEKLLPRRGEEDSKEF